VRRCFYFVFNETIQKPFVFKSKLHIIMKAKVLIM
jgi:hypothetical protein